MCESHATQLGTVPIRIERLDDVFTLVLDVPYSMLRLSQILNFRSCSLPFIQYEIDFIHGVHLMRIAV